MGGFCLKKALCLQDNVINYCMVACFLPNNLVQMKIFLSLLQKLIRLAASDEGNGGAGVGERKVSLLLGPDTTFIRMVLAFGGRTRMPNHIPLF